MTGTGRFTARYDGPTSSLTLLEAGILLVDHIEPALPTDDLAIRTALLYGCPYFHISGFKKIKLFNRPGRITCIGK